MSKKKKKMTPAQAAAARRENGRPKRKPLPSSVKDSGPKDRSSSLVTIIAVVTIAIAVVLSAVYAVPGMMG